MLDYINVHSFQEQEIIRTAQSNGVRISSVILTSRSNEAPAIRLNSPIPGTLYFEALSKGSGGLSKNIVADSYTMQMYSDFIEALNDIVAIDTKVSKKDSF